MRRPIIYPPCKGWLEDLPSVHDEAHVVPLLEGSPNVLNEVYLEVSRCVSRARGTGIYIGLIMSCALLWMHYFVFFKVGLISLEVVALILCVTGVIAYPVFLVYRLEVDRPRDLPIRFNRLRRRMYVYDFKYSTWNPFAKWQVEVSAWEWENVYAESWRSTTLGAGGGLIINFGVSLAVVDPGTHNAVNRFMLCVNSANEHAWAYICTYMQYGPHALPLPDPPRDHDDILWCNIALRLAPKVHWPEDMDLESRTAP